MFQGGLALPAAFLLDRRMTWRPMAKTNPLKGLSIQLAMSQIVAFPAAFLYVRIDMTVCCRIGAVLVYRAIPTAP